MRQTSRQDNGQLVFSDVPPGDYYLIVSTSYRQEEAAYINVKVDGDVTLKVQTNSGARVSGRFVVQGPPRDTSSGPPFPNVGGHGHSAAGQVRPVLCEGHVGSSSRNGQIRVDRPARSNGPSREHERGIAGVDQPGGGEDLAGKPVHFTGTEIIDDLLVVFTNEKAEVEVTLTGLREPEDPENVLVICFPKTPLDGTLARCSTRPFRRQRKCRCRRPLPEAPFVASGRAFTFRLGSVVPGRYLIAAVPSPGVMYPTESAILECLRPLAVPVVLVAGETVKVEVRVSR